LRDPTGVNDWLLGCGLEEDNGRQGKHSVFLGHLLIIDLDKVNARLVRLVVYVLHLGQDARTLLALIAI